MRDAVQHLFASVARRILSRGVAMLGLVKDLAAHRAGRKAELQRSATSTRRILFVDDMVPDPLFGAGYPRAHEIVRALVNAQFQVDHYAMEATPVDRSRLSAMFRGTVRFHRAEGARGLRRLLWREGAAFDVLFISRPRPMRTFLELRWRPAGGRRAPPVVYDAEAVISPREKRRRELYGAEWSDREYRAALAEELGLARAAAAITTVGPVDAAIVRSVLDIPVFVLPHSETNRTGTPDFDGRQDILFVGRLAGSGVESPNVDSVLWFVAEVMPLLDRLIGRTYRVRLAGWLESPAIEALASDRIVVYGALDDLRPLYDQCRLFVAPTRFAAGIPGKVTEAMSEGIPCVVTPLLAEQLAVDEGTLAIAGDASSFAEACAHLYTDAAAWKKIRDGGFAYVAQACSPSAFEHSLAQVLQCVAGQRSPNLKPAGSPSPDAV